jgi:enoyl-CoA hydratase/carnithine racemase
MTMDTDAVLYEERGAIALMTLNRPARRNALSRAIRDGIRDGFRRADADPNVAVVVLTGAGERAFCAGGDLEEMAGEALGVPSRDYMPIARRSVPLEKTLIAAINGAALGGGFLLAQMADLAIAADHAIFGMPEVKVGRGAPWSVPLSRMIPQRIWLELCLTGEAIGAKRAYEIGFLNAVVPAVDTLPTALEMAEKITKNAPLTVRASHRMIRSAGEMGMTAAWDVADAIFEPVYQSEDALEGPRAFREKRAPRWQNR